jgi:hypothetical protein
LADTAETALTEVTSTEVAPAYPIEITEAASEYGFKAANLGFINKIVADNPDFEGVSVPEFWGIKNTDILGHLDDHASGWRDLWNEFKTIQGNSDIIGDEARGKFETLQGLIQKAFIDHPFAVPDLPDGKLFMVRSTSNEDRVDLANPGGNDSTPSYKEDASASIGRVVASYVGFNSLSQRLKSGEDVTEAYPLSACLIQTMVGESLSVSGAKPPISGAIYTDHGHVRIQAAPGHGELIVNSKGNFDNYYVDPTNTVYLEAREKRVRMVPEYDSATKKMSLSMADNPKDLASSHSLNELVARRVANFANYVEKTYGMRMDLEFVYDPNTDIISIVQARPIPIGDRKGLSPDALSNEFIIAQKPDVIKGSVVTPDITTCSVIKDKSEILVCDTITQAKDLYLSSKDSKVKGIIIAKEAPDTGHEAGLFTSLAIPVLHVADIEAARSSLDELPAKVIVLDPRHRGLYQIDSDKFSDDLIKKGMFSSTLSANVSTMERVSGPSFMIAPRSLAELRNADPMEATQLFRFTASDLIKSPGETTYDAKSFSKDLEKLELPEFGAGKNTEKLGILKNLLKFVHRTYEAAEISGDLYRQILTTSGELHTLLKIAEQSTTHDDRLVKYYLDIYRKFEGALSSEAKKDVLSTLLTREVEEARIDKNYRTSFAKQLGQLPKFSHDAFLSSVKLDQYFMNREDATKWQEFCFKIYKNAEDGYKLSKMVKDLKRNNILEYWLNSAFLDKLDKYEAYPATALSKLYAEYDKTIKATTKLGDACKILDSMEHQIGEWAKPKNFAKLHKELQKNIAELEKLLEYDSTNTMATMLATNQFLRQVDIIDLALKSLQTSHEYTDKTQQVANFKVLIKEFWELVKKQPEIKDELESKIQKIDAAISSGSNNADELMISPGFSVLRTIISKVNYVEFDRAMKYSLHLADLHSVIHQNALDVAAKRSEHASKSLENRLPKPVKDLKALMFAGEFLPEYDGHFSQKGYLISLNLAHPLSEATYNILLREHSAVLNIAYNYQTGVTTLNYDFVGEGLLSERPRWIELEVFGVALISSLTDIKIVQHESQPNSLNLKLEISPDCKKKKELAQVMSSLIDATFNNVHQMKKLFLPNGDLSRKLNKLGAPSLTLFMDKDNNFDFKTYSKFIKEHPKDKIIEKYGIDTSLPPEKLELLTSGNALFIYAKKYSTPQELAEILDRDPNKFRELTSLKSIIAYQAGGSLEQLAQQPLDTIQALTSDDAIKAYKAGAKFPDLVVLSVEQIKALTSWNAIEAYKAGVKLTDLVQIYDERPDKFNALTSRDAIQTYQAGAHFDILARVYDERPDKFNALTSRNAREACNLKVGISFEILSELPAEKIKPLTSDDAIKAYKAGIKFEELAKHSKEKIYALTSDNAIKACNLKVGISFEILSELAAEKIKALTSSNAIEAFNLKAGISFETLSGLPVEKIQALTSDDAIKAYKTGVHFDVLAKVYDESTDKFKALTSSDAVEAYKAGVDFGVLVQAYNGDPDRFKALTSLDAVESCKAGVDFGVLVQAYNRDPDRFKALTSSDAVESYKAGATFDSLAQIYDERPDKFNALTSSDAVESYKAGVDFGVLVQAYNRDPDRFKALTSLGKAAYKAGATFERLTQIYDQRPDKFNALNSSFTKLAYKQVPFEKVSEFYDIIGHDRFTALRGMEVITTIKAAIAAADAARGDAAAQVDAAAHGFAARPKSPSR